MTNREQATKCGMVLDLAFLKSTLNKSNCIFMYEICMASLYNFYASYYLSKAPSIISEQFG